MSRSADITGPPLSVPVWVMTGESYRPPVPALRNPDTGIVTAPGYDFDGTALVLAEIDDDDLPCAAPMGGAGLSGEVVSGTHGAMVGAAMIVDAFVPDDPLDDQSAAGDFGVTLAGLPLPHAIYDIDVNPLRTCYLSAGQAYPAVFVP